MTEIIQPPVNCIITQLFGNVPDWDPDFYAQWGFPAHNGIDYGCEAGTPVTGALTGKLDKIAFEAGGFGQYARQDCGDFWLYYCHLNKDSVFARVGEIVQQGRAFCYSGWTGAVYPEGSAGAHLHFGKRLKSYPANDPWKGWRDPFAVDEIQPVIPPVVSGKLVKVLKEVAPALRTEPRVADDTLIIRNPFVGRQFELLAEVDGDGRKWAKVACYIASAFVELVK